MEQRAEFRIVYPLSARPMARVGDNVYSVLDSSEHALRFDMRKHARPLQAGERLVGSMRLAQGAEHAFEGCVARVDAKSAVLVLDEPFRIDLALIFREQRHLRSKFPNWR